MVPWGGVPVQKPWLKQSQPQVHFPPQLHWGLQQHQAPAWRPQPRRPPQALPQGFQVDANARYTGTVSFYQKWKGYGFIDVAQKGVVPQDRLFVHWKQISSDDRFPFLAKGAEVEFGLTTWRDYQNRTALTLRAKHVTQVGGMNIALQDDIDAQEKTFVGGQHLRYTGTLKFFTPKHGFGYVMMDQGYDVDPSVPSELRVEMEEVNAGGKQPCFMENLAVEFGIWRNKKGGFKVYNMTLPGGHPLTQDALENRISMGLQTYMGKVGIWNWRQGWGFIKCNEGIPLPPRVLAKLAQQAQAARQRGKNVNDDKMLYFRRADCIQGANLRQGADVTFQVYIDDKGAGACDVRC
mmetsp:Transcript_77188/g.239714  ORF Transcript_77188/g.239714 Transcript_77188/m.239714 type:complete len:350 (+) Transcript_77188:94-1143(+)